MVEQWSPKPKVEGSNPFTPVHFLKIINNNYMKLNFNNIKNFIRKAKFEFSQIKLPSSKEVSISSLLVFLMLLIASGLVISFDFASVKIIKLFFLN